MKRKIGVILFVIFIFVSATAGAEVTIEKDIPFLKVGGVELKGNLYIPKGKGPFPGVLYVHGGGFVAGSKDFAAQAHVVEYIAENGFMVFSANYRLLQEGGLMPNSIKDTKSALCWFKKNGVAKGLDPKRVGALGESAGGTLVAMLAVTAGMPEFKAEGDLADNCDDSIVAAVPVYPATDFITLKSNLAKMVKNEMIRASGINDKEKLKQYMIEQSPVTYAVRAKPMLLIHGVEDILVPVDQSREFYSKLKSLGKDVEYLELKSAPHGFFSENFEKAASSVARPRAIEFLKYHLNLKNTK